MIILKTCVHCNQEKSVIDFNVKASARDRLQSRCKTCCGEHQKNNRGYATKASARSYQKHKEIRCQEAREYASENRDQVLSSQRKWREKNRERERLRSRDYSKNNLGKVRAQAARRRTKKLSATPKWANKVFIDEIYDLAQERQEATGIKHHVDHIVPLTSAYVCGLHCEDNLQILTAYKNLTKYNHFEVSV